MNKDDTISRQLAIDEIMSRRPDAHYPDYYASIIRNLPSVHEEPKTGNWIIISPTDMYCSECHEIEHLDTSRRFCAYCGTMMVEPQESENK